MVRTAAIGIRVEPQLKEALEAAAAADGRTLANLIERILQQWVDGQAKPTKGRK